MMENFVGKNRQNLLKSLELYELKIMKATPQALEI